MTESFIEDIQSPADEARPLTSPVAPDDGPQPSFLESLSLVLRIAHGRRPHLLQSDIPDIAQRVAMRLWKWTGKNREKSSEMVGKDWDAFAARTTYNEINRHFSSRVRANEVPIEEVHSFSGYALAGETEVEVLSLIKIVWQEICSLSLRQRRALLLHSPQLVIYFMQSGIDSRVIGRSLEFDFGEWSRICESLPLSDMEIAKITREADDTRSIRSIAKAIKKARFDARKKLERLKK